MNRKSRLLLFLALMLSGCSLEEVVETGDMCPPRIFVDDDGYIVNRSGVFSNVYGETLPAGHARIRVSDSKYLEDEYGRYVDQTGNEVTSPVSLESPMMRYKYYTSEAPLQYILLNYSDAQEFGAPESQKCDRDNSCAVMHFQTYIASERCPNKYPTCSMDPEGAFFCISKTDNPNKIVCDGAWINPNTSPRYCGASGDCRDERRGAICSMFETCRNGVCVRTSSEACEPNTHRNGDDCEPDTVEHCGTATNNCTLSAGWKNGECINATCAATECQEDSGYTLSGIQCVASCMPGQIKCGGRCINPKQDNTYCGATGTTDSCETVGVKCLPGTRCDDGVCVVNCAYPQTKCIEDGVAYCANLENDPENCLACGQRCNLDDFQNAKSLMCKGGCAIEQCIEGYHRNGNTCEIDDVKNCGTHGNDCSVRVAGWRDGICDGGKCVPTKCSAEEGYHFDESNGNQCIADTSECCGDACVMCNDVQMCSNGVCRDLCTAPLSVCVDDKAYCANLAVEVNNCGSCGTKCNTDLIPYSTSVYCYNGCKVSACKDGYHIYDNKCEPDSEENCGKHGVSCKVDGASSYRCNASTKQCSFTCGAGFHSYIDGCEADDVNNCGSHGKSCMTGGFKDGNCDKGTCKATACVAGYHLSKTENKCVLDSSTCCGESCKECGTKQLCSNGICVSGCTNPLVTCNEGTPNVYCANLNEDTQNCGVCGKRCDIPNASATYCSAGVCMASLCAPGYHPYNGGCEQNDTTNCGAHGVSCNVANAANSCTEDGRCRLDCNSGYHEYNNQCEKDDASNCGGHNISCAVENASSSACVSKKCTLTCKAGTHPYDNSNRIICEIDDIKNCGYHGNSCESLPGWAGGSCQNGVCVATACKTGFCSVHGVCTNGTGNSNACGVLGGTQLCTTCSNKQYCSSGACVAKKCDGNICQTNCVNTNTACGVDCKNCNTAEYAKAGICKPDGTCYSTVCEVGYHPDNGKCVADNVDNCGALGNECKIELFPHAEAIDCIKGVCSATKCYNGSGYHYHVYNGVCEIDSDDNCTAHGKKCTTDMVSNSSGIWCYNGICQALSCKSGYKEAGDYSTGRYCVKE